MPFIFNGNARGKFISIGMEWRQRHRQLLALIYCDSYVNILRLLSVSPSQCLCLCLCVHFCDAIHAYTHKLTSTPTNSKVAHWTISTWLVYKAQLWHNAVRRRGTKKRANPQIECKSNEWGMTMQIIRTRNNKKKRASSYTKIDIDKIRIYINIYVRIKLFLMLQLYTSDYCGAIRAAYRWHVRTVLMWITKNGFKAVFIPSVFNSFKCENFPFIL